MVHHGKIIHLAWFTPFLKTSKMVSKHLRNTVLLCTTRIRFQIFGVVALVTNKQTNLVTSRL